MTVDELIALARKVAETPMAQLEIGTADQLARAVLYTVGVAQPCGYEDSDFAELFRGRVTGDHITTFAASHNADEARRHAYVLLKLADEYEATQGAKK